MDIPTILKTVAPWIATAMAGPLGGLAVDAAAKALGATEKTADALKSALGGATPEQMMALKQADQDFALRMKELGFKNVADLEKIAADDRADARNMQNITRSLMPAFLTSCVSAAFFVVLVVLFKIPIPLENRDLVVYMCGQLAAAFTACLAFWVGTTRASEDKTIMLAGGGK